MNVLIVEDNDHMRKFIKTMTSKFADEIFECSDGKEAVETYNTVRPDWVLMDIKMKEMDGISATKQIKKRFPEAKILIVTRYNDPHLFNAAKKAGAQGYVLKENLLRIKEIITA